MRCDKGPDCEVLSQPFNSGEDRVSYVKKRLSWDGTVNQLIVESSIVPKETILARLLCPYCDSTRRRLKRKVSVSSSLRTCFRETGTCSYCKAARQTDCSTSLGTTRIREFTITVAQITLGGNVTSPRLGLITCRDTRINEFLPMRFPGKPGMEQNIRSITV